MQIKHIVIRRYGVFTEWHIGPLASGLQVLYGPNEAGKSTLMGFISDVLFGFSPQSPGIAEEGQTFGGRLVLELTARGEVTVERLGSRGKGTVKVDFPDGTSGGEAQLADLLQGLDRSMFYAIFCFDLEGLQNLETLGADEVSDYLFHAGMAGDLSIRALEKELKKKQEELFKPKGQKPPMNQNIAELEILQKDIKEWQKQYGGYQQLIEESEASRKRLDAIAKSKEDHRKEIRTLERQKTLIPYVKEQQALTWRLRQLPAYEPFPEDGLARYKDWRTKKVELEGQLADLKSKYQTAAQKLDAIEANEEHLKWADEVRREREQEPLVREKQNRRAAYVQTVQSEQEELDALFASLGTSWNEASVKTADTSLNARQALDHRIQKREYYVQRLSMHRKERERKVQTIKELRETKGQHTAASDGDLQRQNARGKQGNMIFYMGLGLALMLVFLLMANRQWFAGVIAGALVISFSFYMRHSIQYSPHESGATPAEERLSQELRAYDALEEEIQSMEDEQGEIEQEMHEWCRDHHFPTGVDPAILQETLTLVKDAGARLRKRDRARNASQQLEVELDERQKNIEELSARFNLGFEHSEAVFEKMQSKIDEAQQSRQKQHELQQNIQMFAEQIEALHDRIRQYQYECDTLFKQAQVDDEEAFLQKGRAWEESRDLVERRSSNQAKLQVLAQDASEVKATEASLAAGEDIDTSIQQLEADMSQLGQEEQDLQGRLADLTAQKNQLEEGGTYAERYHRFTQVREQLHEQAQRWAIYRLAEHWLNQAKERYRNERLPQVIDSAMQYFATMTEGRYAVLYAPVEEGFVVERTDGERFSPKQLSRGTVEQLYLALRLALARLYQSPSPYPLITDDILVNFDGRRVKQAVAAIRQMAEDHQVLFFTCHHHLQQHFWNHEVFVLDHGRDMLTS